MARIRRHSTTALVLVFVVALPAAGSGFSVYEQSAAASGRAGAWTAGVDDAAANWYNPAALAWLDGSEIQFGVNAIYAGYETELTSGDPEFFLTEETTFEAVGHLVTPVHLYYRSRIGDRLAWGFGINNPYGLVSEWSDPPVTVLFRKGTLVTFVANPNLAFRMSDRWSFAAGIDYIHAEVRDFSADVPVGIDPGGPRFVVGGTQNFTGDGSDLGWNVAASYRRPAFRAGLTYRSELSPEIEGELTFSESLVPPFRSTPGRADLDLPAQAVLAAEWSPGERWRVEGDLAWAGWSSFRELAVDLENEIPGLVTDFALRQDWDDTFSYRIGASWRQSDAREWRFGAVWDENPAPTDTLRPSIPDSDRWAPTVGYGYQGRRWSVDLYYMYLVFTDADARGSAAEGVIDATYSSSGHLAGITVGWSP